MIKELRNDETITKKGSKFIYSQVREVEMDFSDVNAVATRSKHEIDELSRTIKGQKQEIVRKRLFMAKNKKTFVEAVKLAEKQLQTEVGNRKRKNYDLLDIVDYAVMVRKHLDYQLKGKGISKGKRKNNE